MKVLSSYLSKQAGIAAMLEALKAPKPSVLVSGVIPAFYEILFEIMFSQGNRPLLIVMQNLYHAQRLFDQLSTSIEEGVYLFPMDEFITAEMLASSSELRTERMNTLGAMVRGDAGIVITHVAGATRYLTPKEKFRSAEISLSIGDVQDLGMLRSRLVELGYQHGPAVENPGEFSVRGGIMDVFPMTEDNPLRIEFFDDEVDTIRYFSTETQRSLSQAKELLITPVFELVYNEGDADRFEKLVREKLAKTAPLVTGEIRDNLYEKIHQDIENVKNHNDVELMHKYASMMFESPDNLVDYLEDPLVVYIDYNRIRENQVHMDEDAVNWQEGAVENGKALVDIDLYRPLAQQNISNQIFLSEHKTALQGIELTEIVSLNTKSVSEYHGQLDFFVSECKRLQEKGATLFVALSNMETRNKFANDLENRGIPVAFPTQIEEVEKGSVQLIYQPLSAGFELIDENVLVYSNYELTAQKKKAKAYKSTIKEGKKISDYNELNVGDYVVHLQHGIGQYVGIQTLETNGATRDFLMIIYRGGDKLYVPIDKIHLVQKYVGSEGVIPKVHKLGTNEWEKAKSKVKKTVRDIAAKLIKIYAKREHLPGYAFSKDIPEQTAFEHAFPFVETDDQLKAVEEIKSDMEQPHPMDRLLIGDVGYGKTEVAMRAAFKAVMDGKQVAYLAPTTILSKQQYDNFVKRFKDFPINIGVINRYLTDREQKDLLQRLKDGAVDIIIGTHRLLSKDVVYKDLGLLVIDEEQRFGVEHKEKIKEMKTEVDVLTLTATPIPRTLQMSMIGIRSLSLIETPPLNRYPVQTYVLEEHDSVIRDAVERELARDGQVFYLYNRVGDIDRVASKIKRLVPDAQVATAHGQMTKEQLEETMADFEERKFNVLVCTTIIETGIDIPNANTLIISDAYRLGLSQLYQIRGRVGRSDRIAYAYCTYPRDKILTEGAEKRLQTIKEFTELGSGFKIAMRDLAIRGAGDMIGARQSGFIDSVGLDLYTQLLSEAVNHAKAGSDFDMAAFEMPSQEFDIPVNVDAYIPDFYIGDEVTKIEMYQKIKKITTEEDRDDILDELIDRFGDFPDDVRHLVDLTLLRNITEPYIERTKSTKNTIEFILNQDLSQTIDGQKLFEEVHKLGSAIRLSYKDDRVTIIFDLPAMRKAHWFEFALKLFINFDSFKKIVKNV
ncbi:MAG: transcription-repair coupling factor [Turicibacter sp.]|nr:transcription-repair coupling factor [Turicibacter sp.]